MPIVYKVDILTKLKDRGYTTYKIRKDNLLAQSTLQAIRKGNMISLDNVARICSMLNCQPGELLAYEPPSLDHTTNA